MSHSSRNITNAKLRIFFKVTKKFLKDENENQNEDEMCVGDTECADRRT